MRFDACNPVRTARLLARNRDESGVTNATGTLSLPSGFSVRGGRGIQYDIGAMAGAHVHPSRRGEYVSGSLSMPSPGTAPTPQASCGTGGGGSLPRFSAMALGHGPYRRTSRRRFVTRATSLTSCSSSRATSPGGGREPLLHQRRRGQKCESAHASHSRRHEP